ncbi:MAG: WG repeat-containing protein, partial [Acutalibacteraceae bacterium]|nr:WG repeat-containing protein [Acutalibacteraceae bacterium]
MKKNFIRLLSFAMCLVMTLGVFAGCTSKKSETEDTTTTASSSLVDPKWIIGPTIEAESIEPLVRADYNESTRHYDISYADCFKIKQNGKYGIIDYNGKVVISPKYDSITAIRNRDDFLAITVDGDGEKVQTYINYNDFS